MPPEPGYVLVDLTLGTEAYFVLCDLDFGILALFAAATGSTSFGYF